MDRRDGWWPPETAAWPLHPDCQARSVGDGTSDSEPFHGPAGGRVKQEPRGRSVCPVRRTDGTTDGSAIRQWESRREAESLGPGVQLAKSSAAIGVYEAVRGHLLASCRGAVPAGSQ